MRRSYIANFVLFILIVVLGWFGAWNFYQKSAEQKRSIDNLEMSIEQEEAAVERLNEIEALLGARASDIQKIETAVPVKRDLAAVVASLEEAATTNGIVLSGLSVVESDTAQVRPRIVSQDGTVTSEGVTQANLFNSYQVIADASGRYTAFQNFLLGLETHFPFMDIENIMFEGEQAVSDGGFSLFVDPSFTFRFELVLYYLANTAR